MKKHILHSLLLLVLLILGTRFAAGQSCVIGNHCDNVDDILLDCPDITSWPDYFWDARELGSVTDPNKALPGNVVYELGGNYYFSPSRVTDSFIGVEFKIVLVKGVPGSEDGSWLSESVWVLASPESDNLSGPAEVCKGEPFTISLDDSESATTSYRLYEVGNVNHVGISAGTNGQIDFNLTKNIAGDYVYYVEAKNVNCVTTMPDPDPANGLDIKVNDVPDVDAGEDVDICVGAPAVTLTATTSVGSPDFLWSTGETTQSIAVSPAVTTTYTVTITNTATTCEASDDVVVNVNALPDVDLGVDQTICAGDPAVTLTAATGVAGATFLWSTGATTQSIDVSPLVTTTYTVVVTNPATNCEGTDDVIINVNDLPDVDAGVDQTICAGDPAVNLSVTTSVPTVSYLWSTGETTQNISVTPAVTTTYTVTVTNTSTGCEESDDVIVFVNPLPDVDAGTDVVICEGDATNLTVTTSIASPSYLWSTGETTNTINVSPLVNTTYTVTVTNTLTNCEESDDVLVTVNPVPAVTLMSDKIADTFCKNTNVTFTAGGADEYIFYKGAIAVGNIVQGRSGDNTYEDATLDDGDVIIVVGFDTAFAPVSDCNASAQVTVTVNELPEVAPTYDAACDGHDLNLHANPTLGQAPYTFSWTHASNGYTSVDEDPVILNADKATYDGIYTVQVTDANTCVNSNTVNVIMDALPVPQINGDVAVTTTEVCMGLTFTLTGSGGTSYSWLLPDGSTFNGSTLIIPIADATHDGTYTLTVNDGTCDNTLDHNVIVNALPNPTASNNGPVCAGDRLDLSVDLGGMTSYLWTGPDLFASTDQNPMVSANATVDMAGLYTVLVFDGKCYGQDQTTVVVNEVIASISVSAPGVTTVCSGDPVTFNASGANGSGTYTYEFHRVRGVADNIMQTGASATYVATGAEAPIDGDQFYVIVIDGTTTCTDQSTSITINVTNNPVPTLAIDNNGGSSTICDGEQLDFTANPAVYPRYVFLINSTPIQDNASNTFSYSAFNDGDKISVIAYTSIDPATACLGTSSETTITVNPLPVVDFIIAPVCENANVTYTANTLGLGKGSYTWIVQGGSVAGDLDEETVDVVWDGSAPYSVSLNYVNVNGCTAVSPTVKNITVNALPVPTITGLAVVCDGTTTTYTTQTGMTGYTWNVVGGSLDSQDDVNATATVTWNVVGTRSIDVTYTDANSCDPAIPTAYSVEVVALPAPTITGDIVVCTEHTYTYSTEVGANSYDWQIVGGTITPTANPHEVDVVWNSTGAQSISVDYDVSGCFAAAPTVLNVTVSAVPTPAIVGNINVCANSTETYDANVLGLGAGEYTWVIQGGSVAGALDEESIDVVWDGAAPHSVSLNYVNADGCDAVNPSVENITVNLLPVPVITGDNITCDGTTVVYTTQTGMTGYTWNVVGGSLDSQDDVNATATVTWNVVGTQSIDVTYTDANSCDPAIPTAYSVEVVGLPAPTITGDIVVCTEHTYTYSTEVGANSYDWQIVGGTITPTANQHEVDVVWNSTGAQSISVNYDVAGCFAAAPTVLNVTVSAVPTPAIIGSLNVCANSTETYDANVLGLGAGEYTWVIQGGSVAGALDEETVDVVWDGAAPHSVSLNYVNADGCDAVNPTVENITVNTVTAGLTADKTTICSGEDVTFTASGGVTYEFYIDNILQVVPDPTIATFVASGLTDGQLVTVKAIDAINCEDTHAGITITVNLTPIATISSSDADNIICDGDEVTFTAGGGDTYEFFINGGSVGAASPTNTYVTTGLNDGDRVSVVVTNSTSLCFKESPELVHTVNSLPTAGLTAAPGNNVITGTNVTFTATGGVEYEFFKNADPIPVQARSVDDTYGPVNDLVDGDIITVDVYNASDCVASASVTMGVFDGLVAPTVNPLLQEYCEDDPSGLAIILTAPLIEGVSYQLFKVGAPDTPLSTIVAGAGQTEISWPQGTSGVGDIDFAQYGTSQYRVDAYWASVPGDKVSTPEVDIIEHALPIEQDLSRTDEVNDCNGGAGYDLGLLATEVGVEYELYRDGITTNRVEAGTGAALPSLFTGLTNNGIYTIRARRIAFTGCDILMKGDFTINIVGPAIFSMTPVDLNDKRYCESDANGVTLGMDGSEEGVQYVLTYNDNSNTIIETHTGVVGGGAFTFPNTHRAGSYTVKVDVGGCWLSAANAITIIEESTPIKQTLAASNNGYYCNGDVGVELYLAAKEANYEYRLYKDGDFVDLEIPSDNIGRLTFDGLHTAGEYSVVANVSGITCETLIDPITVTENPLPDMYTLDGNDTFCNGGADAVLFIPASQKDVIYQLYEASSGTYGPAQVSLNGERLEFNVSTDGTYSLLAIIPFDDGIGGITNCERFMNNSFTVGGVDYPNEPTSIDDDIIGTSCDEAMQVTISGVEDGVIYELVKEVPVGSGFYEATNNIVIGDELLASQDFAPFKDSGARYFVQGRRGNCPVVYISTPIDVNIANSLERFTITGAEDICNGDAGIKLGLSGSEDIVNGENVTYSLYLVEGNVDGSDLLIGTKQGTGNAVEFDETITQGTRYYVNGQINGSVCPEQPMLDTVDVNINPLPIAFEVTGSGYYCDVAIGASIGLANTEDGILYQLQYSYGSITRDIGTPKPGVVSGDPIVFDEFGPFTTATYPHADGVFTIVAINPNTLCTSSMNGSISLTEKGDFAPIIITSEFDYCSNENGVLITTDVSELEAKYTLVEVGVDSLITVDGTGSSIEFGYRKAGTYRVDVSWGEDGCSKQSHVPEFTITSRLDPIVQGVSIDKSNVCGEQDVLISIEARELGVEYYLFELGITPALDTLDSTNPSALSFNPQKVSGDTSFEISAGGIGVCEKLMGFVSVSVQDAPSSFSMFVEGGLVSNDTVSYCADGIGVELGVRATQEDIGYVLYRNYSEEAGFFSGNNADKKFIGTFQGSPGDVVEYMVLATNFSTGCKISSSDTIRVVENELPAIFDLDIDNGDGSITLCPDGCFGITNLDNLVLSGSQLGYTYSLLLDKPGFIPVDSIGTAQSIKFGTRAEEGEFTVLATSDYGCQTPMNGTVWLENEPLTAIDDTLVVKYGENQIDGNVWMNDIKNPSIDILTDPGKNIYFSLIDNTNSEVVEANTVIGNKVVINDQNGDITFVKSPSFFGSDWIRYVVYNTDYDSGQNARRDTAYVHFFAGNIDIEEGSTLLIPNAFSPNGDNINDKFVITDDYANEVGESKLEVFNRWGTIVYRSKGDVYGGEENSWDGTSNAGGMVSLGDKLPSGTYFYVYTLKVSVIDGGVETKEYSGFIELRR